MRDEFDEESRPRKKKKPSSGESGGSTVKILLIVFGSLAGLGLAVCCGVGAYGYFLFQKNFGQVALTTPVDIQKLTAEMTDIIIPPEFVPQYGSAIFGIKTVNYQWCPTGDCMPQPDGLGSLSLSTFHIDDPNLAAGMSDEDSDSQFSDEVLKLGWLDFKKTEHEFEIRGKKCKFYFIQGEQLDFESMDEAETEAEMDEPGAAVIAIDPPGETPAETPLKPAERKGVGHQSVRIHGEFPGKTDKVTLEVNLSPEDYQEEKILGMLRTIR